MRLCRWLTAVVLFATPLLLDSQSSQPSGNGAYGFQDLRLGTTFAQFKREHPSPRNKGSIFGDAGTKMEETSECSVLSPGVTRCNVDEEGFTFSVQVSALFVDGKLGLIQVEPPMDSAGCFLPRPKGGSAAYFFDAECKSFPAFWKLLTENLGNPARVGSPAQDGSYTKRWESSTAVAQFEFHMCGPWWDAALNGNGWGIAVSELLAGQFCGQIDSLEYRQPAMLYVDKHLGRILVKRLQQPQHRAEGEKTSDAQPGQHRTAGGTTVESPDELCSAYGVCQYSTPK